jgi:PAS domain S-box-containing protein
MTAHDDKWAVAVTRSDLRGSYRAGRETPPLLRGEISESTDEESIEVPVPVAGSEELEGVRILHVDDDANIAELTKTYLERIDDEFTVTTAASAVEALTRLNETEFDCIISDYDMPNTNGIEFLEIVREQHPDLPFILFTGKGSEEVASDAIAAGVTDYMQKGIGADQYEVLANRTRNAVERYRTQQKFWDALTWYQRLVEQNLAGVFIIQEEEFVYVNEYLADVFGYAQSELVGASPLGLASDSGDESVLLDLMNQDHSSTDSFEYTFTGQRADMTEIPVEVHGGSIQYEGEPGWIGILWSRSNREAEE